MLNFSCSKKITGFSASFLLAALIALLAGCGGGGAGTTTTTTTAAAAAAAAAPSLTIALTSGGVTVTSISSGAPATVTATVKDTAGTAVANAVVTFSTDAALATIAPVSATALTDATGVANVTLSPASLTSAGAATITATTQVGTTAVTGSKGYSVGAAAVTMTNPAFGVTPLSAFGTTSVSVTVSSNGVPVTTPQTVSFTSPCASSGKAVLTAGVATVNGVATASYRDNGCAGTDTVSASVSGITSSSAALTVTAPTTGSIQFISATPSSISLRGMGGAGRQESSQVIFKVVDTGGNPIGGKTVSFSLSTAVGGIALTTTTAISDPTTGQVVVGVSSGAVSTPARVLASTCTNSTSPCTGTTLSTQSDLLTITTGIPDQQNFSLSATSYNIEGWNHDGTTTVITARLADHFNNPVPDGTAVNFTAEGGSIVSSCTTTAGACSATLTSQALRPNDGRVTVLAYAVGEEGFTDLNGNGLADTIGEMIDANGVSTDMGEAYVDYNESGARNGTTEPFIDFNGNVVDNAPDAQYNGVLCTAGAAICSAQKSIHVRGQLPIVFSGSDAVITINGGATIALAPCVGGVVGAPSTFTVTVVDLHGNAMPAGTTVAFSSDNGTVTSSASYTVPSTSGCRTAASCPALAALATFGDIPVTMKSDAILATGVCANTNANGTFTVKVTTPKGVITNATKSITD